MGITNTNWFHGQYKKKINHKNISFAEHLFNLKFAVKDLERNSKKCEKQEKLEKAKAKKAIQKGNVDVARIHAENAIRQKSQSVNYLRMSARVDAVASRVQSALTTRNVTLSNCILLLEFVSYFICNNC